MKKRLKRWQDMFYSGPYSYDYNLKTYNNRPYKPYANKKSFYMWKICNLKIDESIIIEELCRYTLVQVWIGHITFKTDFKYQIEQLDEKVHKVTRILQGKNTYINFKPKRIKTFIHYCDTCVEMK